MQGIFQTQGLNPCLLHLQVNALPLSQQGSPYKRVFGDYIYIYTRVCVCVHKHLKCNELIMQYTHLYSNSSLFLCHELTKTINIFRTLYLLCLLPGVPLHLIRPYCASLPSFKSLLKDCLLRGDFFDYSI